MPSSSPSSPTWVTPRSGACDVCGELLGTKPYLVTQIPNGVHLECRDWSRVPFPAEFDQMLARLRRVRRQLAMALELVDSTGKWLADAKRAWPRGAAETFREVTTRRESIRAALLKLRWPSSR